MNILSQNSAVDYLPRGFSDHAPLLVVITQNIDSLSKGSTPASLRLSLWQPWLLQHWRDIGRLTSNPITEWEAFRAVMRGVLIHAIASCRAELLQTSLALEREMAILEAAYVENPRPEARSFFFTEAQRKYELHLMGGP